MGIASCLLLMSGVITDLAGLLGAGFKKNYHVKIIQENVLKDNTNFKVVSKISKRNL